MLCCVDPGKIAITLFNWPHFQILGAVEMWSEFTVLTMLPIHLLIVSYPCTETCGPSNNTAGLLHHHGVAMKVVEWAISWNVALYNFEPDFLYEQPATISDKGRAAEDQLEGGLVQKVLDDITHAGMCVAA